MSPAFFNRASYLHLSNQDAACCLFLPNMIEHVDDLLSRLLTFIRAAWPLLYAAFIVGALHYGLQKLRARQLANAQETELPRPIVFDERLKKFRRFETGDKFVSADECSENREVLIEEESRADDSGHASFSTDSIGVTEPYIRSIVELTTRALYDEQFESV